VLARPPVAEPVGQHLATLLKPLFDARKIEVVVSPAIGGLIIGHEVARAVGAQFFFTERHATTNRMTLRRGFEITPGQAVVVIEDVVTTGGSTREVVDLVSAAGATVLAAGSIVDRSNGRADVGAPRMALATLDPIAWEPEQCPLCAAGEPLVKPGSRRN